jgi:uncharacterized membrane protein (DUF106 family)
MSIYDPWAALIIISLAALGMNVISGILNRLFVYTPDLIAKRQEIQRIKQEYQEAKRLGDEKRLRKMEKKMQMAKKLEAEVSLKSMRPFIITIIVFWVMWGWLNSLYGGMGNFVILPFPLPIIGLTSNFFWWYLISSFAFSALTRRYFYPSM